MQKYAPWVITLLLGGSMAFSGCSSKVPVEPVAVDNNACRLDARQMNVCITNAALHSGWSASSNGDGKVRAVRRDTGHMAKIAISHTAEQYHIDYLDSKGMGYNGSAIDPLYDQWVSDLQNGITLTIASLCDEMGRKARAEAFPPEEVDLPVMVESVPEDLRRIR
jgi:hypothetical protein